MVRLLEDFLKMRKLSYFAYIYNEKISKSRKEDHATKLVYETSQTETRMSWPDNITTRTGLSLSEAVQDTSKGQQWRWIGESTIRPTLETQSVKRAQPIFIALWI